MINGKNDMGAGTLRAFDKAVAKFLYKHPRFGIKNLMVYVIAGQLLVFIIGIMDTTNSFYGYLAFSPELILKGEVWRLLSFVFIPPFFDIRDIFWLFISLYFEYFIALLLRSRWGAGRFTIYYFCGVFFSVVYGFVLYLLGYSFVSLDTTYINLSLFFAVATLFPDMQVRIFFIIPIKMKWLALLDAAYFVYATIVTFRVLPFYPLIPIFNYLLFFAYVLADMIFQKGKETARSASFKANAVKAESEIKLRSYRHKCEVCGRTDKSDPYMDFRYCSRCKGYHCYCMDHINSHQHYTE